MKVALRRAVWLYAGFLVLFCLAVFGFWLLGTNVFSILLSNLAQPRFEFERRSGVLRNAIFAFPNR